MKYKHIYWGNNFPAYWIIEPPTGRWLIKMKFSLGALPRTVGEYNTKVLAEDALAKFRSGHWKPRYNHKPKPVQHYDDRPLEDDLVDD